MDPVRLLREWIARAVERGGQVAISHPSSTIFVAASALDALVREAEGRAVAGERARCLDALDGAWRRLIEAARAEGRRDLTSGDVTGLVDDIRSRIIAGEGK